MRFGSVCSGIEAASVAWTPLGWEAAWFSEIEPFPCAVLSHRYPGIANLGDMRTVGRRVLTGDVEAPEVLCGGTPCQSFSLSGLRLSLADERGNLTLCFVKLANAVDHVRRRAGRDASIVVWENVPGVLSTKDNAFGCFLAGLAGEDGELRPPGQKPGQSWADAGAVYGPERAVAWRTLDAQHFGLAQRRRRVFVVASAREGFDPSQVLFEWEGVRRDLAPGSRAQEEVAGTLAGGARTRGGWSTDDAPLTVATLDASFGRLQGCSGQDANHGHSHLVAFGGNRTSGPIDVAPALLASPGSGWKGDFETETIVTHTLRGAGLDATEDGSGRGTPLVLGGAQAFDARQSNAIQYGDKTGPLDTDGHTVGVLAFDTTQVTCPTNGSQPRFGDPCHALSATAHVPAIAFSSKDYDGADASADIAPTLRAMGHNTSHANGGGQVAVTDAAAAIVRRITVREAERLQGFEDDYTLIPWRGRPATECPDGPRYRAIGNSWAVPVARWVGRRIARHIRTREAVLTGGFAR